MRRRLAPLVLCAALTACQRRAAPPPPRPTGGAPASEPLPSDPAALYQAGKEALTKGRYREAAAAFTTVTRRATDDGLRANAWLALGAADAELHEDKAAVGAYEQVTRLRPDDPDAWRVLAEGLSKGGKAEARAAALEHLIALDPDDLGAYLDLAGLDVAIGKLDASKDVYLRYEVHRREAITLLGKSKDAEERAAAAEVLGGARDSGTAKALLLALTDKEARVRLACARALERIGVDVDKEVRPGLALIEKRETDPEVRAAIAEALAGTVR